MYTINALDFVPHFVPRNMSGKLSYKIRIKKEHTRVDGTSALYLSIYYNKKRKRIPLNLAVPVKCFDIKKQRVKRTFKYADDYNLIIEKTLGKLNDIEVNLRLNDEKITVDKVVEDLKNPTLRICFNQFATNYLENEFAKNIIKKSSYKQQKSSLQKIINYKDPLLFSDIDNQFVKEFRSYLKHEIGNKETTVSCAIKNFKKYLNAAIEHGIRLQIDPIKIKTGSMKGDFTFLVPEEVIALHSFYCSPFINASWKNILQRYLFACFTGIRLGDLEALTEENFIDGLLVYYSEKTGKLYKEKLNKTALSLVSLPEVFIGSYSRQHINSELKEIAKACNIKKRLYFHSSRHTFATNYLISGGLIQDLQEILGHSKIETTMVYVHAVSKLKKEGILRMDDILEL